MLQLKINTMGNLSSTLRQIVFQPPIFRFNSEISQKSKPISTKRGYNIPMLHLESSTSKTILVYSHGNAEDINSSLNWCSELHQQLDVDVVVYDYCGYGMHQKDSDGVEPTEENVVADITDVINYLLRNYSEKKIVLYGRSLGAAPSISAAAKFSPEKVCGLIIQSGFTTPVKTRLNVSLPFDFFRNEDIIPRCQQPCCIIHGKKDNVVPFTNGETLARLAPNLWRGKGNWISNGTHNNLNIIYTDKIIQIIRCYINDVC